MSRLGFQSRAALSRKQGRSHFKAGLYLAIQQANKNLSRYKEYPMIKNIFTTCLLVLSSVAFADQRYEPVIGHFVTQGGVQVQVQSGGCTYKRQFTVKQELREGVHQLAFVRLQQDPCRAYIPYGEIISFSFEELGLKAGDLFMMANPEGVMRVSRMQ
jgi:hypothetical protein